MCACRAFSPSSQLEVQRVSSDSGALLHLRNARFGTVSVLLVHPESIGELLFRFFISVEKWLSNRRTADSCASTTESHVGARVRRLCSSRK